MDPGLELVQMETEGRQGLPVLGGGEVTIEPCRQNFKIDPEVRLAAILADIRLVAIFCNHDVALCMRRMTVGKTAADPLAEDVPADDRLELVVGGIQVLDESGTCLNIRPALDLD